MQEEWSLYTTESVERRGFMLRFQAQFFKQLNEGLRW